MAGMFDDLIPEEEKVDSGTLSFDDLIPETRPEDQVDNTGVPGQSQTATEAQIAEKELANSEKPLNEVLTTGMYRSGDPDKLYERFKEEGTTTKEYGWFGEDVVSYKGRTIPEPEKEPQVVMEDGKMAVRYKPTGEMEVKDKIGQFAGISAPRELALTISSLIDTATGAIDTAVGGVGLDTDLTGFAQENLPKPLEAEGAGDEFLKAASETAVGGVIGQKIAGALGAMIGSTVTLDSDTSGLLFGDGGLFKGVPVDENGKPNEEVLARKINLLMDAAALAAPVEYAGRAIAFGYNVAKTAIVDQIAPMVSDKAAKNVVTRDIVEKLNLTASKTEVTPEDLRGLAEVIRKNRDFVARVEGVGDAQFGRTTMSAINEGMNNGSGPTIEAARDLPNAILRPRSEGFNPENARSIGVRAMELEKGGVERGLADLELKMKEPIESLQDFQRDAVVSKGGQETIGAARDFFADEAVKRVDEARGMIPTQQAAIDQAEESARQVLRESPQFGKQIQEMEKSAGLDIYDPKIKSTEKVIDKLTKGIAAMVKKKNELFDRIPEDVVIDIDSFNNVVLKNEDVLEKYAPAVVDIVTNPDTMIDFKVLNNEVLPRLNPAISKLRRQNPADPAIDALIEIRENITDTQLKYLEDNGEAAVAEMAKEARKFYREDYMRFAGDHDTPMGRMFDAYHEAYEGKLRNIPVKDKLTNIGQEVAQGVTQKRIGSSGQILDFMFDENTGIQPSELMDVYLGDVVADVSRKMITGGIDEINPDEIIRSIDDSAPYLKERAPAEYQKLVDVTNRLRDARGNIELQQSIMKEVKDKARQAEEHVYNGILSDFITKVDGAPVRANNGYQAFKTMLRGQQNGEKINRLVDLARSSDNPAVLKGMQSAYYTELREMIGNVVNSDKLQKSAQGLNINESSKLLGDLDSISQYGDMIFGQGSKELEGYKGVIQAVVNERNKRLGTSIAALPKGYVQTGARGAITTGATFVFGVLNRMGAMVNRAGNQLIKMYDPEQKMTQLLDLFHSDPDSAAEMLEGLAHSIDSKVPGDVKKQMWNLFVRSGLNLAEQQEPFGDRMTEDTETKRLMDEAIDWLNNPTEEEPVDQEMRNMQ